MKSFATLLLAEFALQEAESGVAADLVAAPLPEPVEVYVTLTSDKGRWV